LAEIAKTIGVEIIGNNQELVVSSVSSLSDASPEDITFFDNKKYIDALRTTHAAACIIAPEFQDELPQITVALLSDNPYYSYALLGKLFYSDYEKELSIHPSAIIGASCQIGKGVSIGANVVLGERVEVGDGSVIGAGSIIGDGVIIGTSCRIASLVTISFTMIADLVSIHEGVRIGQDGFGFATYQGKHERITQLGRVIIEEGVNIGANSTIDRGAGPDTVIGAGTQIDNLVQIGHNVKIGKGCVIVSQVGIAGSTELGDYVVAGGQVGIAGHLKIGTGTKIAAQSGITKNIPAGSEIGGTPSVPLMQYHRQAVALKRLTKRS
ncbi:MAG: UDP-3-O-(3-hydroxymyristoyl)glucosamine N-acyltransferase, partial [Rickettsiales bacterium]|nr:UDP-3-O-(3-hydroxymyristoyl)glucosamine N-acyltransferase [Rickettsiales bacterium]